MIGQEWGEPKLGIAVGGRAVEVVDPELEEELEDPVGLLLAHGSEGGGSEDHAAAVVAGSAERNLLDHGFSFRGRPNLSLVD